MSNPTTNDAEAQQAFEFVHVATERTSPSVISWRKQKNCLIKLKSLGQKYVADKQPAETVDAGTTKSPPAVVPVSTDCDTTAVSTVHDTFSAMAGLGESTKSPSNKCKQSIPMLQFLTELVKNTTARFSCTNSSCGSLMMQDQADKPAAATGSEDGFDASTFDSILDMTEAGVLVEHDDSMVLSSFADE